MNEQLRDRLTAALADKYALEREIGEGGMAFVFLARDLKHDRNVAIKVMKPELAASIGGERFLREIQMTAKLSHPHILPLYDSGEADGFLYFVMPFVEGETLSDLMTRERQLPIDDAIRIAREVADALAAAHKAGLIHRDIKPDNVMITGGHAVVMDFGISDAVGEAGGEKLTQTGMAIGTPAYMSPEQASGAGRIDGRADIYSLGCMLYEMLVGQIPFTGPTPQAIMARHSMDTVTSPRIMRDTVSPELEEIVYRAMAKTPADRYRNATELSEALAAAIGTGTFRPVTGVGPAVGPPAAAKAKRGLPRVAIAGLAGLAVVIAGVVGWQLIGGGAGSGPAVEEGFPAERIAVLYFEDRSPDGELAYLADGLTEALINELGAVEALEVISRNGVRPYRDGAVSTDSIARALEVGTLVGGSVAQSGDVFRVDVELINANTDKQIASRQLERPRAELFALQDDIADSVSIFLRERLGAAIEVRRQRAGTQDVEAWEALQRAEQEADAADMLAESDGIGAAAKQLADADSLLAQVEEMDPDWVTPVVERGWLAYRQARLVGPFDKAHNEVWTTTGLEHANRALAIDPNDADALELRATLLYWRHLLNLPPVDDPAPTLRDGAERDYRASIEANPNQASALSSLSHLLMNKGDTPAAKLMALRSYEADPYLENVDFTLWRLFQSSIDLDDRVEAARWCNEGLRRFPDNPRFSECQLWLYTVRGQEPDIDRAWNLLDQYVRLSEPSIQDFRRLRGQMIVGLALARAGLADSARAVAKRSRGNAEVDPTRELAYFEAILRSWVGDVEEALRLLSLYLATNPELRTAGDEEDSWWFEGISDDPRYQQLYEGG
jgi:TolB-like protein